MAQTQTQTRTQVQTKTRIQLMQATTQRFLEIAGENGYDTSFYQDRLDVFIRMELLSHLHMIIYAKEEPISGIVLRFDWEKHRALVEAEGEDFNTNLLDQYGLAGSITETLEALRTYVGGLYAQGGATGVRVWYRLAQSSIDKHGSDRIDQMIDVSRTPEGKEATRADWAKVVAVKAAKGRNRTTTVAELPETSFDAW